MQQHDSTPNEFNWFTEDHLHLWRPFCPSLQVITTPDKCYLYRQGMVCPHVFLICKGIIKISQITEQGDQWTVALLRGGDITGCLHNGNNGQVMEESAQTLGEATVVRLDYPDFKQLIARQSELLWPIFELQCIRRQQAERKLLNILAQPVENRVLSLLKELAELFGKRCVHGYSLEIRLTQQELADLVGASRPVVSTIMNELRSRGILDYTRDLICVKDELFSSSIRPA